MSVPSVVLKYLLSSIGFKAAGIPMKYVELITALTINTGLLLTGSLFLPFIFCITKVLRKEKRYRNRRKRK